MTQEQMVVSLIAELGMSGVLVAASWFLLRHFVAMLKHEREQTEELGAQLLELSRDNVRLANEVTHVVASNAEALNTLAGTQRDLCLAIRQLLKESE